MLSYIVRHAKTFKLLLATSLLLLAVQTYYSIPTFNKYGDNKAVLDLTGSMSSATNISRQQLPSKPEVQSKNLSNASKNQSDLLQQISQSQTLSSNDTKIDITAENEGTLAELRIIYAQLYSHLNNTNSSSNASVLPQCPQRPPRLVGSIKVYHDYYPVAVLSSAGFRTELGGSYRPSECRPRSTVAIIIPFRNRNTHLSILLLNLHPFLQKQQISYTIYVINQLEGSKFNRAMLMNIGYVEAMRERRYDCIIFHDVDLLPENDKNLYTCPEENPRHMSVAVDKFDYKLPYEYLLGGVVAVPNSLFLKVNGYSNLYFGWGGEDDDFSQRCRSAKMKIHRYPTSISRYQMIKHDQDSGNEPNPIRRKLLKSYSKRQAKDGLNSLIYTLDSTEKHQLYTKINARIDQRQVMNAQVYNTHEKFPFLYN